MSTIVEDSLSMQKKYGMLDEEVDVVKLNFRIKGLQNEENKELNEALERGDAEEVVDALIDTIVVAVGTLQILGVDVDKAWADVFRANMSKVRGTKPGREQSGGFDLMKPEGWIPPDHNDNLGILSEIFKYNDKHGGSR